MEVLVLFVVVEWGGLCVGGSSLTTTVLPGSCLKWTLSLLVLETNPDAEDFSLGVQSEN